MKTAKLAAMQRLEDFAIHKVADVRGIEDLRFIIETAIEDDREQREDDLREFLGEAYVSSRNEYRESGGDLTGRDGYWLGRMVAYRRVRAWLDEKK